MLLYVAYGDSHYVSALVQIFQADPDAKYFSKHAYDLNSLEPVVAKPHSPDNRDLARNCRDIKIDRVYIGSCTGEDSLTTLVVLPVYEAVGVKIGQWCGGIKEEIED